jgi:hypothetical protein
MNHGAALLQSLFQLERSGERSRKVAENQRFTLSLAPSTATSAIRVGYF